MPLFAILAIGVLLFSSLTFAAAGLSLSDRTLSGASPYPTAAVTRDPILWPFAKNSIWNLPIGASASYVPANVVQATAAGGLQVDADVLVLTPNAPLTPIYYNGDAWNGGTRCDPQGGVLFYAPIPTSFVIPGAYQGSPDGSTPNYATAFLAADGHTLYQGQPVARCKPAGNTTMWWFQKNEDLYGTGISGAHGGSMLSSVGGTIRLGELVPGGAIRHALKVNFDSPNIYPGPPRWPALARDGCAPGCYQSSNPALRMGALLALQPNYNFAQLETEPARIIARSFQDYGGYLVDHAGWSVYGLSVEFSPSGHVASEFRNSWGYDLNPWTKNSPWARDLDRIFMNLAVVDNWDSTTWQTVSLSNGALGAGLGAPRIPWAPDFGSPIPDTTPPYSTASVAGPLGANGWYVSPVDVAINSVDLISGVSSIKVRLDGGAWQSYAGRIHVAGDGVHTVDFYAADFAGNTEIIRSLKVSIDSIQPTSSAAISGTLTSNGSYRSPVTVTLSGTDATSGVQSILYRIDGGAQWAYTAPFRIGGSGPHTLEYAATDWAGNKEGSHLLSIPFESSGAVGGPHPWPVSALATSGTAGKNGWYISDVTVTLSGSSAVGSPTSVAYRLDGGAWNRYAAPVRVVDGRHTLDYQALDADGYQEPMHSMGLNVDSTPPSILPTSPDTIGSDGTVAWSGADSASGIVTYEVSVDGGAYRSLGTATTFTQAWSAGSHVVVVQATDGAGNMASKPISFRVVAGWTGQPVGLPQFLSMNAASYRTLGFVAAIVSLLLFYGFQEEYRNRRRRTGRKPRGSTPKVPPVPPPTSEEPAGLSTAVGSAAGPHEDQIVEERIPRRDGDPERPGQEAHEEVEGDAEPAETPSAP
jgi:hypothetical protein